MIAFWTGAGGWIVVMYGALNNIPLDVIEAARITRSRPRDTRQRMRGRLQAHGAAPSAVRQFGGIVGALAKMPLDLVRGEKAGRNARDGFATEHMEIASYEL